MKQIISIMFYSGYALQLFVKRLFDNKVLIMAGYLTFTLLLGLVPLITVIIAALSYFLGINGNNQNVLEYLSEFDILSEFGDKLSQHLEIFVNNSLQSGLLGLLSFIFVTLMILNGIENIINSMWSGKYKRGITKRIIIYISLILLGPLFLLGSLAIQAYIASLSFIHDAQNYFNTSFHTGKIISAFLQIILICLVIKIMPRAKIPWSYALTGAIVAELLLLLSQSGLYYYLTNIAVYNNVYGALAVIPILMLKLYLSWISFLVGVQVTELLHRRKQYGTMIHAALESNESYNYLINKIHESNNSKS